MGIEEGNLEKCKNEINSLRSFLYPNVAFEIIANRFENRNYLLVVVRRQTGGPFMVSEKAERNKRINLKPGRYVRIESDSRLARVDEEYDLLRKFANFHFSSLINADADIDDLNVDFIREYLSQTSNREIMETLDKTQMARSLGLLDKNDPTEGVWEIRPVHPPSRQRPAFPTSGSSLFKCEIIFSFDSSGSL